VVGTVRVIQHPAAFIGGTFVDAWTEVRVEEKTRLATLRASWFTGCPHKGMESAPLLVLSTNV
jgi:hypothetical protein